MFEIALTLTLSQSTGRGNWRSVLDLEVIELAGRRQRMAFHVFDVLVHAVVDAIDDLFHFLGGAFHEEFDSAVGEVFYVAEDVVAESDVFDGVAETNALDSSGEMAMEALNGRG
jgi:hypothetical protein